ncbi:carbon-nitrogen hydrolase family protein [Sphingomonas sp. 22176]|uniref:carbon-nitrogen hydrolase family protein n=1 Tax=Sphingomonas sp. 22176 TaxID=3453884 RepID=UPI003F83BD67
MRIAAVQCAPVFDDAEATSAIVIEQLRWADANHVDMVLFPEAWLLGHAYDPGTIHARADGATSALPALCARIAGYGATLVLGTFERVGEQIFNSAVVIEHGRIVGRYAKAHPNEHGVTPGTAFPVFTRSRLPWGINICNDANYPAAAARLADQGASLILYPLNNLLRPGTAERWREKSLANLIARARETGCWVASADVAGAASDRLSYGCTAIVSPIGEVVARVPERVEGLALFELPGAPVFS